MPEYLSLLWPLNEKTVGVVMLKTLYCFVFWSCFENYCLMLVEIVLIVHAQIPVEH